MIHTHVVVVTQLLVLLIIFSCMPISLQAHDRGCHLSTSDPPSTAPYVPWSHSHINDQVHSDPIEPPHPQQVTISKWSIDVPPDNFSNQSTDRQPFMPHDLTPPFGGTRYDHSAAENSGQRGFHHRSPECFSSQTHCEEQSLSAYGQGHSPHVDRWDEGPAFDHRHKIGLVHDIRGRRGSNEGHYREDPCNHDRVWDRSEPARSTNIGSDEQDWTISQHDLVSYGHTVHDQSESALPGMHFVDQVSSSSPQFLHHRQPYGKPVVTCVLYTVYYPVIGDSHSHAGS